MVRDPQAGLRTLSGRAGANGRATLGLAALSCLLAAATASAQSGARSSAAGAATATATAAEYAPFALEFEGRLRSGAIADFDADGRIDIGVLLSAERDPTDLRLATCLQGDAGFAGPCPTIRIPSEARAFDVADIDGAAGAELVILTPDGLRVASFAAGRFSEFGALQPLHTLFAGTGPGKTARLRFLLDLEADGRAELVVPTIEGPRILRYAREGLVAIRQLQSHAEVTYRLGHPAERSLLGRSGEHAVGAEARFSAPEVFLEDFDGDGRVDIATLQGRRLRVFLQQPGGEFPERPGFEWERTILDADEQADPIASEGLMFADLDGEGALDIIATKWALPSERTRIDRYVYYARDGLRYPEEPDQKVRSESVDRRLMIADLNADGRADLVVPFFHFAVTQAVKVVVQNAVKIQFRLFLMGADGRYAQDADKTFARVDRRIALNYDIDIMGYVLGDKALPEEGSGPLLSFDADANGDGYPDLLADTGSDRLAIYFGNERARYSNSPDRLIDHESTLSYDLEDLNGDGRSDVITYHGPRDRTPPRRIERRRGKGPNRLPPARDQSPDPDPETDRPADATTRHSGPIVRILLSR